MDFEAKGPPRVKVDGLLGVVKQYTADGPMPVFLEEAQQGDPRKKPVTRQGILSINIARARSWADVMASFDRLLAVHQGDQTSMRRQINQMNSELIDGLYGIYDDFVQGGQTPFVGCTVNATIKAASVYFKFHEPDTRHVVDITTRFHGRVQDQLDLYDWFHRLAPAVFRGHALNHARDDRIIQRLLDYGAATQSYDIVHALRVCTPTSVGLILRRARELHVWTPAAITTLTDRIESPRCTEDEIRELLDIPEVMGLVGAAALERLGIAEIRDPALRPKVALVHQIVAMQLRDRWFANG